MRLDTESLRALPVHMQEQVALSFVPPAREAKDVAGPQRVAVRRLRFISRKAAARYRALVKQNAVQQIVMGKNEDGLIDRIFYTTQEVYENGGE